MDSLIFTYGNAGWTKKTLFLEEQLSSHAGAPFIYNDVLIVVPSSRMKRAYDRTLLDIVERKYGSLALVQPDILTLQQFFETLYAPLRGPRLIDENSRLILLEGIVKEHLAANRTFNQSPDLLAPSLSAALATMIEQLSTAGIGPEDLALKIKDEEFSDKPQVKLLLDVYLRYAKALHQKNITDPAGVRTRILSHFDPAVLSRYNRIIIDGIQDAGPIETSILRKVTETAPCTWLVNAPSAELLERAGDFHPLRAAKEFLFAMDIKPGMNEEATAAGGQFLASALFSDRSFDEIARQAPSASGFLQNINLLSAVNPREEVSLIARAVKGSLRRGTAPDSILVAFPALDEYGPLVEEIFTDYGIPYNRALGRQLSTSPVATAIISLLRACQEDFSGPSLLRVFSAPFLKFGEFQALAPALERFMRDQRIAGGKDKLLIALNHHTPDEADTPFLEKPLKDLFSALAPFSGADALPLASWMERLSGLIAWSGLASRVALIRGPLNINFQAYKKLSDTLASLAHAGTLFPEYSYTFNEWLFLLKKTFMHARFQVPPEDEGGVQVLGLEESMGRPWEEVYLGGLIDSDFPQRLPQNIFLPERTLETMGVRTLERARMNAAYHFYRLLLSADMVTLTWPENQGDRPIVPSPFLEELTPLKRAGLLNRGIEKTSGIQFSLKVGESRSIPELAKSIGLAHTFEGLQGIMSSALPGLSGIIAGIRHHQAVSAPSVVKHHKKEFSVTELDVYLRCPYDYLVTRILCVKPLEEVTEDLSPMDRGSKVHAILRNFYLSWNKPVTRETRNETRALLKKLADSAFDKEADTFRNRRDKERFLGIMAERFLDAEEEFWKQGMRPVYLEQKIERFRLVLSNGEEVALSAKIDRIDVDQDGNFIIVDYKTGKYPLPKMSTDQEIFQLPVYAAMARSLTTIEPALKKPIGLAYYDLAGTSGAKARDVVLFNKEARDDHSSSKPNASPKSEKEFGAILEQSLDKARRAIEGILAGDFPNIPRDENTCRYCPNEMMCEKESET
jgi:ATP-dependent helicase/nuclease subunit B